MNEEDLRKNLSDPWWRICHLYKIIDKKSNIVTFIPNKAQEKFLKEIWYRNIIPKARQRGFSTVIQILMLDTALFNKTFKGKVIAQDKEAATEIFRDKIKFAYDRLPSAILKEITLKKQTESELVFSNNSSVAVSTSARSGTVNFLHVSEFGKISAKYPDKAKEVITGSIPAVPSGGLIFIESTAEGQSGEFYRMVETAKSNKEIGKKLSSLEFKLHFYSWWDADEYEMESNAIIIKKDNRYFDDLEKKLKIKINKRKRNWYVFTRELMGSQENMWQEYPSTLEEAFKVSLQGTYYAKQLSLARKQSRITSVPYNPSLPVHTFWDIGANDETAIWFIQSTVYGFNAINYMEASNKEFAYFINKMQKLGYVWGKHFLPHDAKQKRQLGLKNMCAEEMIQELVPGWVLEIVPRISSKIIGIQQTRNVFQICSFDETNCKTGLLMLAAYRKDWDKRLGNWKNEPFHGPESNGCLVAGTLIDIDNNKCVKIENISIGDYVFTPTGNKMVVNAGLTKISTEIIEIILSTKEKLYCTPEHKIFTIDGVIKADSLCYNDIVITKKGLLWKILLVIKKYTGYRENFIESLRAINTGFGVKEIYIAHKKMEYKDFYIERFGLILMEILKKDLQLGKLKLMRIFQLIIGSVKKYKLIENLKINFKNIMDLDIIKQVKGILLIKKLINFYIELYGLILTVKYQKDIISTIKIKIKAITKYIILNYYQLQNIVYYIVRIINGWVQKKIKNKLLRQEKKQKIGIEVKRGVYGTLNMQKNIGIKGVFLWLSVLSVKVNLALHFQQEQSIVAEVVSIKRMNQSVPVYDLTIKDDKCYFANGILVSNSDAFRQFGQAFANDSINNVVNEDSLEPEFFED